MRIVRHMGRMCTVGVGPDYNRDRAGPPPRASLVSGARLSVSRPRTPCGAFCCPELAFAFGSRPFIYTDLTPGNFPSVGIRTKHKSVLSVALAAWAPT
jgi:hypothetical protein